MAREVRGIRSNRPPGRGVDEQRRHQRTGHAAVGGARARSLVQLRRCADQGRVRRHLVNLQVAADVLGPHALQSHRLTPRLRRAASAAMCSTSQRRPVSLWNASPLRSSSCPVQVTQSAQAAALRCGGTVNPASRARSASTTIGRLSAITSVLVWTSTIGPKPSICRSVSVIASPSVVPSYS